MYLIPGDGESLEEAEQPGRMGREQHHPSPHGETLPKTEQLCQEGRGSCRKGSNVAQKLRSSQGPLFSKPHGVCLQVQTKRLCKARAPQVLQHQPCCRRSEWCSLPFCKKGSESLIPIKYLWLTALLCHAVGTGLLLNGHGE